MKPGVRAVGVAESYGARTETAGGRDEGRAAVERSTLAAVVTRADRAIDGLAFGTCTVGGDDATDAVRALLRDLDRDDVRYVLIAGVAPAWFNLIDLRAIETAAGRPVLSISFDSSPGLEPALEREFSGDALEWRLETYRRQPPRERVALGDETVFVRAVGLSAEEARRVVRAYTPGGGRPEPLRVARFAARAADRFRAGS